MNASSLLVRRDVLERVGGFDAIRKGQIDATVSQPADQYAKYALQYTKAAIDGNAKGATLADTNGVVQNESGGEELWMFLPFDQLDKLRLLWEQQRAAAE